MFILSELYELNCFINIYFTSMTNTIKKSVKIINLENNSKLF